MQETDGQVPASRLRHLVAVAGEVRFLRALYKESTNAASVAGVNCTHRAGRSVMLKVTAEEAAGRLSGSAGQYMQNLGNCTSDLNTWYMLLPLLLTRTCIQQKTVGLCLLSPCVDSETACKASPDPKPPG